MEAIILMGMAGSGKSTVGKILASTLGWKYISTGDIARDLIKGEWEALGMPAPEGEFKMAFYSAMELLSLGDDGVIIDGLPRKEEQVKYIDELVSKPMYYVIDVDKNTALQRLVSRDRKDDTPQAIAARINHYNRNLSKILEKVGHPVVRISGGDRTPDQIADVIASRIT